MSWVSSGVCDDFDAGMAFETADRAVGKANEDCGENPFCPFAKALWIRTRAWLILILLSLQREQATQQAAAVLELLRSEVAVEQARSADLWIFREASVAAR